MSSYYGTLHSLKEVLLAGEALTLMVRLIFQVLFTLPCSLEIMQVLLASIIYCRRRCEVESQVSIFSYSGLHRSELLPALRVRLQQGLRVLRQGKRPGRPD